MTIDVLMQPPDFQKELCDLQVDSFLQSKVNLSSEELSKKFQTQKIFF